MLVERSCGAVVFRRDVGIKYLLLHYEAGHWDFVKGNVELNEEERDTAMRELKEETGIAEATFVEDFRKTIHYFYRRNDKLVSKEVVFYLIQTHRSEVNLSFEHIGYEWLDYYQAIERLTFKNGKEVLKEAHELLERS